MTIGLSANTSADGSGLATEVAADATLQIRMLGPLQVTRPDGTTVDRAEWRTGKVADLLRMLALQGGEPVSTHTLVTALWPGSDPRRGNASLRTAASQVRRVVGAEFLERSLAGLRLRNVWVDVIAFRELSAKAHQLALVGELPAVNAVARQATALYRGDFAAHDDGADWAHNERRGLSGIYQVLLCDAAEAATGLGLAPDAVDFAGRAVLVDPFSERASRLLMRGHADVGEISLALREYERCRTLLAEELGIDPSPQTREVHIALLRSQRTDDRPAGPGRRRAVPPTAIASKSMVDQQPTDPDQLAEAKLRMAVQVCIPQRHFLQAKCFADEAAALTETPRVRARAIVARWLPEVLFGGARAAREPLQQAARLAEAAGDSLLSSRLEVLLCLAAHDTGAADFPARWTHAATSCEVETEVNWAWLMIRIALERGDLETARLAGQLPLAARSGPLAGHLHQLASATLLAELGETDAAMQSLMSLVNALRRSESLLMLPETLARLIVLQADHNLGQAESNLTLLDQTMNGQQVLPREAYLRLLAVAAIQSARGRTAAAAAAAARAAEIADNNRLPHLAAGAHEICADYTARARSAAPPRGSCGTLSLTLRMVAV